MDSTRKQDGMNDLLKSLSQQAKENIKKEKSLTDEFKDGLKSEIDKTLVDLELNRSDFESVLDWFGGNNFFAFCKEGDGWGTDETVSKLFIDEVCGIGSTIIGALLMPLCPFLGIAIIATGVIPSPIKDALKKELQEDTFDIIPFKKIPSIKDEISEEAKKVKDNVDGKIKAFAKIMGDLIKEQKKIKIEEKKKEPDKQEEISEEYSNIESDDSELGNKDEGKEDIKKSWKENIKIKLPERAR